MESRGIALARKDFDKRTKLQDMPYLKEYYATKEETLQPTEQNSEALQG